MRHARCRFALLAAAGLSLAAAAAGPATSSAPEAGQAPPPHEPLAMTLGLVERPAGERAAGALLRRHPAGDVLPRIPPEDIVRALIDSTSESNIAASIQRLQDFGSRYVVADSCWASAEWIAGRFLEYGYTEVERDTFRTSTFQDSVLAVNVLAYKAGTTEPEEYVVLGGHYDSVTTANFEDPFAPAPGADDNASAVAAVLEAARVLRDVETERSIVFACWSAEEVGLWGSHAWVGEAIAQDLDVVLYLNLDCVGYDDGEPIEGLVYADSSAIAVAAYMAEIAAEYAGLTLTTTVHPLGTSDQNSFWEAGYNVLDTSPNTENPHIHGPSDLLEHLNPELTRRIAAVNIVATAAVAGIPGTDRNLPPETTLIEDCASTSDVLTMRPTFEWRAADFDGQVTGFEYLVAWEPTGRGPESQWIYLPRDRTSVTLAGLDEDTYRFSVRAIDDRGSRDPTPATHAFATSDSFVPTLTVETNFLPARRVFRGHWGPDDNVEVPVFENERLALALTSDASSYCGRADSVALARNDSTAWSAWHESPHEFVVRPALGDTAIYCLTRDENGARTIGKIALAPVATPRDLPLLRVDDWLSPEVDDEVHDAFYSLLLADRDHVEWDPLEHIEHGLPTLPPMEELGRYETVLWTLDRWGGFLRAAQAESVYHALEGYVRAGGNVVLEGQSALTSFGGGTWVVYRMAFAPGDFVYDHVGVDSLRNAGALTNPMNPQSYGYAFLAGIAVDASLPVSVAVDTLGKWADTYELYGGVPCCEVVRPTPGTRRLYIFDSYLNTTLDERPCGTIRYPTDGTGTFACFGFPFYYLKTVPAIEMCRTLLDSVNEWQAPADLVYFEWDATPDSVVLAWYLDPSEGPLGCDIERRSGAGGDYARLNAEPIHVSASQRFTFTDRTVLPSSTYSYRLLVTEQWGGTTLHGPWAVVVPAMPPVTRLALPYPNPARSVATIRYAVGEEHTWVTVRVYDVAGRLVRSLFEGPAAPGEFDAPWDLTNERGDRVAAGVYFVRARIGRAAFERKIVVLR